MSLREIANADLGKILENEVDIVLIDPTDVSTSLKGLSNDIHFLIDPDTGQGVSGRIASVALYINDLENAGLDLPRYIADPTIKPWRVQFDDLNGNTYLFKIMMSHPDRDINLILCMLELYE